MTFRRRPLHDKRSAMSTSVAILPYADALAPDFRAINAAWIRAMFVLEPPDEEVLADPRGHIVD